MKAVQAGFHGSIQLNKAADLLLTSYLYVNIYYILYYRTGGGHDTRPYYAIL